MAIRLNINRRDTAFDQELDRATHLKLNKHYLELISKTNVANKKLTFVETNDEDAMK